MEIIEVQVQIASFNSRSNPLQAYISPKRLREFQEGGLTAPRTRRERGLDHPRAGVRARGVAGPRVREGFWGAAAPRSQAGPSGTG